VLPIAGAPIAGGAVLVGGDGRIRSVGPDAAVPKPNGARSFDLGDAALLPGLVNTHAHLELTALRGLVRDFPFQRWIATIRAVKERLSPEHFRASARWGVLESFAAGITTTGDTGSSGACAAAMSELGARGVAYQEVFGPDPDRCDESVAELQRALERLDPLASERLEIGVSPHAPYTVSAPLLRGVVELARRQGRKLAMHLAESREERLLLERGEGPFAEALRGRGIAVVAQGVSSVAWADRHGLLAARPLLIHCVNCGEDDLVLIASRRASVAHCPWSNAVLGHGRANLAAMRRQGVTIGVGTDSVAAGGGLDLFRVALLAAAGHRLSPRETLSLMTAGAAAALGMEGVGVLAPGAWGDLAAVRLDSPAMAGIADPEEAVAWCATAADVAFTAVAGRVVFEDGCWPDVDVDLERRALESAAAEARAARASVS
jgi:5-methylthioadenosine/S-adenosylhomocysteine deaminase